MKKQQTTVSKDVAERYTQGLGHITQGTYEQILLADEMRVPQALGYPGLREWVNERLGGYVRQPIEEREKIAKELRSNGKSFQKIAEVLGVAPSTARQDVIDKDRRNRRKTSADWHENRRNRRKQDASQGFPPDTPREVEAKLQAHADEGMELIVWNKIKDLFISVWEEMLERLDQDERECLLWAIHNNIGKYEEEKKYGPR